MFGEAIGVDPIDQQIGARLRAARETRQIPLARLAKAVGVEPQALGDYEAGAAPAPASVVIRIARALEAPASELIGEWREGWRQAVDELARSGADGTSDVMLAFTGITDARVRRAFLDLARTIVGAQARGTYDR